MTLKIRGALPKPYAVFSASYLRQGATCSLKESSNSSRSKETILPIHLANFGILSLPLSRPFYGRKRDSNLKFLLTTRPYGKIKRGLRPLDIPELPVIHLSGESDAEMYKISAEIEIFVRERVKNIRAKLRLGHEEQQLLLERLLQIPNRTYLWAQLTLELIESEVDIDKRRIVDVTTNLPNSVYDAYERILSKSRNSEQAKKLLHIIVGAARPLTVQEMGVALRLQESHRSYLDLDIIPEERFRDTIRDLCGLFVTILDSRLYLIHQTAKEFLI
ncbi:unnamed protein product [Aspergillus oryzae]|uniref:Unnamed protein product n=1 Tax=Aspergillus oryzae TaxID=5062 RepID=A0AAN4YBE3_ASPOZ|nr:unnamed protein product [Aspergillus oryzae]